MTDMQAKALITLVMLVRIRVSSSVFPDQSGDRHLRKRLRIPSSIVNYAKYLQRHRIITRSNSTLSQSST